MINEGQSPGDAASTAGGNDLRARDAVAGSTHTIINGYCLADTEPEDVNRNGKNAACLDRAATSRRGRDNTCREGENSWHGEDRHELDLVDRSESNQEVSGIQMRQQDEREMERREEELRRQEEEQELQRKRKEEMEFESRKKEEEEKERRRKDVEELQERSRKEEQEEERRRKEEEGQERRRKEEEEQERRRKDEEEVERRRLKEARLEELRSGLEKRLERLELVRSDSAPAFTPDNGDGCLISLLGKFQSVKC